MTDAQGGEEVLSREPLVASRQRRGPGDPVTRPEGWVDVVRPFVYPIPANELPVALHGRTVTMSTTYVGVLFASDLPELPTGRAYLRVRFAVRLADPAVRAVGLDSNSQVLQLANATGAVLSAPAPSEMQRLGAARPIRFQALGLAGPGDQVQTSGLLSSSFSWTMSAAGPPLAGARSLVRHATLELPKGSTRLAGHIMVAATIARASGRFRQNVAAASREVPFDETLAAMPAEQPPTGGGRPVRLIISADVKSYSANDVRSAERLQASLVQVMATAREATGVVGVEPQPQGDCLTYAFPPGSDDVQVLPAFLDALAAAVRDVNSGIAIDNPLRLRVGAARGATGTSAAGWSGQAVIAATRLRDSSPAREAIDAAGVTLVVTVSDELYQDVLAREIRSTEAFRRVLVQDPAKDFEAAAWLHVAA